MTTFLFTLVLLMVIMMALGLGVVFGSKPLKGSCGGPGESCRCSGSNGDNHSSHGDVAIAGSCARKQL